MSTLCHELIIGERSSSNTTDESCSNIAIFVLAHTSVVIDLKYEYYRHHDTLEATGVWEVEYSYLIDKVRSLQAQPRRSAGNCFSLLLLTTSS
jgi:hypothetical protein